jgi:hypothetical protein
MYLQVSKIFYIKNIKIFEIKNIWNSKIFKIKIKIFEI